VAGELLELSEHVGYLPGRVYALYVMADARLPLGDFGAGEEALASARALSRRLGPAHRLHVVISLAELRLGLYRDADWGGDAPRWEALSSDPSTPWRWITVLAAAQSALAYAWRGADDAARRVLGLVLPVLEASSPRTLNQNDAVALAGATAWLLADSELATRVHPLAVALLDAGVGDYAFDSNELTAARAAALLGRREEAAAHFDRAREALARDGRRPLAAIALYDEAMAAARAGVAPARKDLEGALADFESLGMPGWAARARGLLEETAGAAPAGLSPREVEILQLLAGGRTNREIAAELVLSVHTVERHLANAYRKLGVRNRAEATAFALRNAL
jgi:DNA-binding CsgD family transcriptional regulator